MQLNRRDLLAKCAALGAITFAPNLSVAAAAEGWLLTDNKARPATPAAELGPFYKRGAPSTVALRAPNDPGLSLTVAGVVYNTPATFFPARSSRSGRPITPDTTTCRDIVTGPCCSLGLAQVVAILHHAPGGPPVPAPGPGPKPKKPAKKKSAKKKSPTKKK